MIWNPNVVNLALSGGGIRGLAFTGVFDTAEQRGYSFENISGVSAGAMAGAIAAAGYSAERIRICIESFEYDKIKIGEVGKKVAVVSRFLQGGYGMRGLNAKSLEDFLFGSMHSSRYQVGEFDESIPEDRCNFFKNIITFSKEGCLLDGDYLEDWMHRVLARRGVRTFADLRGGAASASNPNGYKMRMTAVDANRGKLITLPDDAAFYGIDPDTMEVAKAVRMSTSVPFAFKPVELIQRKNGAKRVYHIVDGGVLDNFPIWLVEDNSNIKTVGFRLENISGKKTINLDTPYNILKGLLSMVHDFGIPKKSSTNSLVGKIDTGNISFLDFELDNQEKEFLFTEGRKTSGEIFSRLANISPRMRRLRYPIFGFMGRR